METEYSVIVNNVSKDFKLANRAGSFKNLFTNAFKQKNKKSKTQHALKDISFKVKKGEFFGIVGRNGSGKSTLLKIIAGIYQPTKGNTSVSGKLVPFIELGVGFNPELTGYENVYLNGALLGFSKKEIDAFYDEVVEFAELEKFMDQKLKNYSSGMQVRLAFSMAIRAKADILLIDEVLAVGDADFQRKCYDYFNQLKGSGVTVIFVSHNMTAVREFCDRAVLVDKSRIIETGTSEEVAKKYLELFLSEEVVDSVDQVKDENRWGTEVGTIKKVFVTTNPEHINISVKIKAKNYLKSPMLGFRMSDIQGNYLTGTNTKQEEITIKDLQKNDEITLSWEMKNIFRDGRYVIDVAMHKNDAITVLDWWNSSAKITVKKPHITPYAIDPEFVTKVK